MGIEQKSQFIIYQAENGQTKLVRLADDTVWLTQPQMAELFQTTQQNISQHINNIFETNELIPNATHKKFLLVRQEGDREVQRNEVESAHRYVIQKRLKIAGAWWLEENAEIMLAIRVNRANNHWNEYWETKAA